MSLSSLLLLLAACFEGNVYIVEGTVVSVGASEVTLDHEPIAGLMDAMTMAFPVRDPSLLQALSPGDRVIARYELTDKRGQLIALRVVGHDPTKEGGQAAPSVPSVLPVRVGERFPSRTLALHDGSSLLLGPEQTERVVLTYVFTRCPQPEFCPAMISRLQGLQAALGEASARIVAVTLDPAYDTPEVLSAYAASAGAGPRWHFARTDPARPTELEELAMLGGLPVMRGPEETNIAHGLRLLVLDKGGTLIERYDDARFPLDRVVAQLTTGAPQGDPNNSGTVTPE